MANKTSISDIPSGSEVNDFGTERYVDGLVRFIERSAAPITIALQGEWGSGKTSLMNKLHDKLCGDDKEFYGVTVNTWEYSMLSSPETSVVKILEHLVKALSKDEPNTTTMFKKLATGFVNMGLRATKEAIKIATGPVGAIATEAIVPNTSINRQDDGAEVSLSDLRDSLNEAIKKSLSGKKRGVIVFVDDLDRLNPPLAVEILELLKNVFTLDNCIFVLAIDYDVVVKGLKPKFGELTEKNEREFRSFFDKIIQVPFSLPVNNYRPMNFVLKSLAEIGYLSDYDISIPAVKENFSNIVEASVGKNPRSIKRLINTLSLLDCIAKCGIQDEKAAKASIEDKLLNFIIVAMQICYPKIYRMLSARPTFTLWDEAFAAKMGIELPANEEGQDEPHWEEILEAACAPDTYLTQHFNDIRGLLYQIISLMRQEAELNNDDMGKRLKEILDKSSVTGLNAEIKPEELDKKDLINRIQRRVSENLSAKHPELLRFSPKKNTGNGGFRIWYGEKSCIDVTFSPSVNSAGKIALCLSMHFIWPRPERMKGLSFDELMQDDFVRQQITALDNVLSPLLKEKWFFNGRIYEGNTDYFKSYTDELRFLHEKKRMSGDIANNPEYWIALDKPSHFETPEVIDTLTDLLIANVNYRKAIHNFK